jgi:hypothetical protein
MSFTRELKQLDKAVEGIDACGCWREVLHLHRELGRTENALGRAAWTMRYGRRGEWRAELRHAAAETLREARRAASVYDIVRLRGAAGRYVRLAGSQYAEVAALMLKPEDRSGAQSNGGRRRHELEQVAAEVRWNVERPARDGRRRRGRGRGRRAQHLAAA